MKNEELLKAHPKTTKVLIEWFTKKMFESFTSETPEDMKHYMTERGVTEEQLSNLIDINPRIFFDVFDSYNIFIEIKLSAGSSDFNSSIIFNKERSNVSRTCFSRIEAEVKALEEAFKLLEKKLTND